ncbi:ABC transporter permease [Haloplanus sp. GCM10025708]|uniref:ABC transporter permease n=1 Tax=Haloferacaceae TaxID=1644056 RepID=UPI003617A341
MGDPRLTIARRELQVLRSEKTIVLALLIQLFIAAFSSFLVVGLVSLYDPGSVEGYTVDAAVTGDARDELLAVARETEGLDAREFSSAAAATDAFHRGRADVVLDATTRDGRLAVTVTAPDSNVRTTVVVVTVRDLLQTLERVERRQRADSLTATPLDLPPPATTSPYFGFTYTVLIPLLLFLPVFISGSIAVDSVTEEFERGTLELLRVAPVSMVDIVDGKVWAAAALAPGQAALWVALLELNGTHVANAAPLLALVGGLALFVVALGTTVALFAPDRRSAQFLYSVGILVGFGGAALVPFNPVNVVARLAIGSAGTTALVAVGGYVALAAAAYVGLRRLVPRATLP